MTIIIDGSQIRFMVRDVALKSIKMCIIVLIWLWRTSRGCHIGDSQPWNWATYSKIKDSRERGLSLCGSLLTFCRANVYKISQICRWTEARQLAAVAMLRPGSAAGPVAEV